jgi:hypothetical protein
MGKIYSVGMTKNHFDVAPEHGRTPFYVDAKHDGDNIDDKNPLYNEITCLYYLWKHHGDTDYIGLEHYRRAIWDRTGNHLLEPDEISEILKTHDVILTNNYVFFAGTMDRYCLPFNYYTHHIEHMNEYMDGFGDFYRTFMCTHYPSEFSWTNMFIANTDIADEYCRMVFHMCDKVKAPAGAKRFYGYACEKLWSPWAAFKGLKAYHGRIHIYSEKPKDANY